MAGSAGTDRLLYRVQQGWRALVGPIDRAERDGALEWLPLPARTAFLALPAAYQRHHLAVYRRLVALGCRDGELLTAALLHDSGKVEGRRRVALWQRTLVVLLQRWPSLLEWLGRPPASRWRYGFYLDRHHPALGAARAAALGCSPRVVALIAAHQSGAGDDAGLALLRAADDAA